MYDINLLPAKKSNKKLFKAISITLILLVILGSFAYFGFYTLIDTRNSLEMELFTVVNNNTELQQVISATKEVENLNNKYEEILSYTDFLIEDPIIWSDVLSTIEYSLSPTVTLNEIQYSENQVIIMANTKQDIDYIRFMVKLNDSNTFKSVEVNFVELANDRASYNFQLTCLFNVDDVNYLTARDKLQNTIDKKEGTDEKAN